MPPTKRALILSGGGARAAYQVGVLRALAEILPREMDNPFPIICGTSAGAINAVALAAHPGSFRDAVAALCRMWQNLTIDQVYNSSWWDIIKGAGTIGLSLFNEGVGRKRPLSMLDNAPLWQLLGSKLPLANIEKRIASGRLHAVSVTAMGYTSGESVTFFQGQPELEAWKRYRRVGAPTDLRVEHLVASSAIPTVFPAVRINREYFGDGALRQLAPISPALHLGAEALFIIGVSSNRHPKEMHKRSPVRHSPSMAQIVGHLLNSAFIDALEGDLEHLERINDLLKKIPKKERESLDIELQPVDNLVISPSKRVDSIAGRKIRNLPSSLRFFLRTIGATTKGGGATAASFLLFNNDFVGELLELGYLDTMWESENIKQFFEL